MDIIGKILDAHPNQPFTVDGVDPVDGTMTADETAVAPFHIFMPGVQTYLPCTFQYRPQAEAIAMNLNDAASRFSAVGEY
jgi:hypothetical protein